ncbi:MAG: hypothetical protein GY719_25735 [bacterium]|nr:hypothetical protein [bacterium]
MTPAVAAFRDLSLGARFRYRGARRVWVKLSPAGTIAEWDPRMVAARWVGQRVCSFDDGNLGALVEIAEARQ